tara:strand:+ start:1074 stop:1625 length:552 start_codon:yes stop_codon:yes gene_type:complete
MATVYEIIQGLSQAAANAYDGALTEEGEPVLVGLQREEGDPILDKRVLDGFNVRFRGNLMSLSYHSEVQLKEVYTNGFESDIEQRISEIASFLKKEYRKITGNSVQLTKEGEVDMRVESTSRIRSWVTAECRYKVGGLDEAMQVEAPSESTVEASWQTFLDLGGWKGKRPKNDARKKGSEVEK